MPSPDVIFLWQVWPGTKISLFACFTYSAFFNSPFFGCSNAWDQALRIKCQAMTTLEFLLFILVVLILTDCEQSALTFLLCHSKRSGTRVRGERRAAKPHHFTLSLAERSSEERTMKNDRLPSVVLIRPNIIRDESSKST